MQTKYPNWFEMTAKENFESQLLPLAGKFGLRFLQIGAFTGDATVWMVDNVLVTKNSVLEDVDIWTGSDEEEHQAMDWLDVERTYDSRIAFRPNVIKYKMDSKEFLRSIEEPTYDFIYIDGDHTAEGVLQDAVLAWRLLKPGGIIAFDDYLWGKDLQPELTPKPAIDRFLAKYTGEYDLLSQDYQLWLKKK
jgi:hypothetical protein